MSLWKKITQALKRSAEPTISATQLFEQMCLEAGVHPEHLRKANVVALFEDWYDGDAHREQIASCFDKFREENPSVRRRLKGVVLK
jgi:quinol monooxygenase YgiN